MSCKGLLALAAFVLDAKVHHKGAAPAPPSPRSKAPPEALPLRSFGQVGPRWLETVVPAVPVLPHASMKPGRMALRQGVSLPHVILKATLVIGRASQSSVEQLDCGTEIRVHITFESPTEACFRGSAQDVLLTPTVSASAKDVIPGRRLHVATPWVPIGGAAGGTTRVMPFPESPTWLN